MNPVLPSTLRNVRLVRYVSPLREGGSLPGLAEGDDGFLYVVKFRGAGQGVKTLIAELVVGELARALGLRVPELVFADLNEAFGRLEPDEEIQDLLRASTGLNLGLHFLSGAATYDPVVHSVDAALASAIVWLDAWTLNVDRTARNTNMLFWHKELWLIDHGAALYVHHTGPGWEGTPTRAFPQIKDHVLLAQASALEAADAAAREALSPERIRAVLAAVPADWLSHDPALDPEVQREAYALFLEARLAASSLFVQEAKAARHVRV